MREVNGSRGLLGLRQGTLHGEFLIRESLACAFQAFQGQITRLERRNTGSGDRAYVRDAKGLPPPRKPARRFNDQGRRKPLRITPWMRWSVLLLLLIVGIDWVYQQLPTAGDFLAIPSDKPVEKADLLVILGGGLESREITGAELMRDGWANKVLLTGISAATDSAGTPSNARYRYLLTAGVSKSLITTDGTAKNTWQEGFLIREVLRREHARRVLIVTDPPHFRRLRWVCQRTLEPAGIDFRLVPTRPDWWSPKAWWTNRIALEFVFFEYLKLIYYPLRYGLFVSLSA